MDTHSIVELGAGLRAPFLGLLLGFGSAAGQVALDLGRGAGEITYAAGSE